MAMYAAKTQQNLTKLIESTGNRCLDLLNSIFPLEEHSEIAFRSDAALLIAQIVIMDAATDYLLRNREIIISNKSKIRATINTTTRKLMGDARSLELSEQIGKYDALMDIPSGDICRILAHACG